MGLFGKKDKLQIITFQTYGTESHLYLRGRALEDEEIDLSEKGFFRLLCNSWKRFDTDEIRNTPIRIQLADGRVINEVTDKDGYFRIDRPLQNLECSVVDKGWLNFEISYGDTSIKRDMLLQDRFLGEMLIPSKNADFGVISDIDDTILHTGVVSLLKWRVILNTVFRGANMRRPLEGAANFYHLLHRGKSGKKANPIFYVSHSPWNLYRYLELFLKTNGFPKGPILLRSMSSVFHRKTRLEKPQKQKEIVNIFKTYPDLSFILIGDAGEYDADIFIEIAKAHPTQIAAIYLRTVHHQKRMRRVKSVFENYKCTPMFLIAKTEDAVIHARKHGFIQ